MANVQVTDAFAAAQQKAKESVESQGAHRIKASTKTTDGVLSVALPIAEMAKAKPSKGGKQNVGFMLEPIVFTVNGVSFTLSAGWCTLTANV